MAENVIFDTKDYGAMTTHFYDVLGVFVYVVSPPQFELVLGQTYKVVWDGVAYETTALDTGAIIPGSISIGNGAAWGYPGNNEPFSVVYTPGSDVTFVSMTDTASTTHTVAVYHITEAVEEPVVLYTIKSTTLNAIADSIRAKTGSTDKMTAEHFPGAISSITGGGGGSAEGCVTVTFMNGDTELLSRPVYIGDDCPNPVDQNRIDTPTKESTAQYNYVFYDWGASDGGAADGNILKNITEDKTVYAVFTAVVRTYTITYYDSDGVTELYKEGPIAYGSIPTYVPTKVGFTFDGWIPDRTKVTGDAIYTAIWSEEATIASGYCGENALWKLYENGVMRVYGTGAMEDYAAYADTPYYAHRSEIKIVTVENGITYTGARAFQYLPNVTTINLPDSLTTIGRNLAYGCTSLTSITIPDSVTSIGIYAFNGCTSLTSITIPSGVTVISESMIRGCTALTSIKLMGQVTSIGAYAFADVIIPSFTIPDSVTDIGEGAFYGCKNLTSINIPASVTRIGKTAFAACNSLAKATFGDPYGWVYNSADSTGSYIGSFSGAQSLSNSTTNATYLCSTYTNYYWFNK